MIDLTITAGNLLVLWAVGFWGTLVLMASLHQENLLPAIFWSVLWPLFWPLVLVGAVRDVLR